MQILNEINGKGLNNLKVNILKHFFDVAPRYVTIILKKEKNTKKWNLHKIHGILFDVILAPLYDPLTIFFFKIYC